MNARRAEQIQDFLNSSLLGWIGLVIALLVLALAWHYLRAWFQGGDDPADEDNEFMQHLTELNRQGDLSDEEFRSIKSPPDRPDSASES